MIPKIANNKTNQEDLNLEPTEKIVEKLNYYRTLFAKLHELSETEINELTDNISTFFNLKTVGFCDKPPENLFRISNNNKILSSLAKELNFLTDISHILAPPIECCWYNRCNIPKQQILYCATDEATAYWETKPQKGDVITISHFKLKENTKINCNVIRKEKVANQQFLNQLQEVAFHIDDFFTDIFSREIPRDKPLQYLFSAVISSQHLFYPIPSDKNIEAIIYPSVQRKKHGYNLALQNDLILMVRHNNFKTYLFFGFAVFVAALTKELMTGFYAIPLFLAGLPIIFVLYFRGLIALFFKSYPDNKPTIIFASQYSGSAYYDGKDEGYKPTMKEKVFSLLLFMGFMFLVSGLLLLSKNVFKII